MDSGLVEELITSKFVRYLTFFFSPAGNIINEVVGENNVIKKSEEVLNPADAWFGTGFPNNRWKILEKVDFDL